LGSYQSGQLGGAVNSLAMPSEVRILDFPPYKNGVLAQLARAPACHVGGREFKSRTSRQLYYTLMSFFIRVFVYKKRKGRQMLSKLKEVIYNFYLDKKLEKEIKAIEENSIYFVGTGQNKMLKYDGKYYVVDSNLYK
jgi:hypothetical protein